MLELAVGAVAILAGAVASVAGFGVGSLLTPLLAARLDTKLAVAAVSIPHLAATALRFWMIRGHVDRKVFVNFGVASAAGGLTGALLHERMGAPALTVVFGGILVLAGALGVTGFAERLRLGRPAAWSAGAASGLLGGLVGNQGGIRSAGLLGFDVRKEAFVATATATGLIVDGARMPVYLYMESGRILQAWPLVAAAAAGCLIGTVAGMNLLKDIPERAFKRAVSALILLLGASLLARAGLS